MSKFSSFKKSQLLFESWRGYIGVSDAPVQEQTFGENMTRTEKAKEMFQVLTSMSEDDPEAFNKALRALPPVPAEP